MLTEAEQASEKEEEDAGILVRRKRGIAGVKESGSHQPEPVIAGEEQRSVYVNGDQGILSTGGTSGMQIREENPFIDDKDNIQVNGKKDSRVKEFRKLDNSLVSEEKSNHRSTDVILENGSTSNLTKGCNEFGVARSEFEAEEDTHVELEKKSKLEVTEIDLEKVLEEQDTHDLYCPNCNSCITKRVILRKRKRTVRETQCDTPTAKVQQLQHLDATAASADEMTELSHDREPDIFRCLSCFSFFIPIDAGFNIFRIFGRRGETENQVTSQLLSAKTGNIGTPVLKPVGSSSRASESGVQFGVEPNNIFGEDPSFKEKKRPLTNVVSDAIKLEEGQSTIEEMDADANIWEHFINDEKQVDNPAKGIIQRYLDKIESEDPNLGKGRTITDVESWINDGKQVGDLAKGIVGNPAKGSIQRYLDKIESEDPNLGKGRTITDMESWINDGKQVGDLAKGILGNPAKDIIQRYQDKIESEDPNLGKGRTITDMESWINDGKQVGDLAKGSMQRYLDKTESEDPNLGKSQPIIAIGDTGNGTVGPVDIIMPTFPARTSHSQFSQNINVSVVSTHETQIYVGEPTEGEAGRIRDWDVLKSIVYGGLIESVASLSIVSSAAGGNASTLNIVALALAYLIGGLFVIAHNISELRDAQEETTNQNGELVGRYWELLGRKANSRLHATIAVLSYIVMGLLPPVIYGFSFWKSDDKEYKLTAVAASSFVCISLLAIGKAHVSAQRAYIKSLAYYLSLGYAASGLSYVAGVMIHRLLDQLGLYDNSAAAPVPPSDTTFGSAMQPLAFLM